MSMSDKRKVRNSTATYCRSYLITLGLIFSALGIFILQSGGAAVAWAWWEFILLAAMLIGGVALMLFGLFGPSSRMESWAEASSRHEASFIIMALAYPVYLALLPFYSRR